MSIAQQDNQAFGVAIDLGSTTIAISIMDSAGNEIESACISNPQTRYGLDVISRVRKAIDNPTIYESLKNEVFNRIKCCIVNECNISFEDISVITICGNSIMQHFFRGLSVDSFAQAPFIVKNIDFYKDGIYAYPPCFSAFVGADILCGAHFLHLGKNENYDLLVDLGTNGELLLINNKHGYATSTACGPVFDNAVLGARYGSDCIHALAQCLKRNLIDRTGKIAAPFFDKGIVIDKNIIIKQQNIRDFQLAKGAILAGIQCLMKYADITDENIHNVYISGGLGFYMNLKDAFSLNMFPDSFYEKIKITGNTSLEGAKLLTAALMTKNQCDNVLNEYENIKKITKSYELSNLDFFQDIYMNSLEF